MYANLLFDIRHLSDGGAVKVSGTSITYYITKVPMGYVVHEPGDWEFFTSAEKIIRHLMGEEDILRNAVVVRNPYIHQNTEYAEREARLSSRYPYSPPCLLGI